MWGVSASCNLMARTWSGVGESHPRKNTIPKNKKGAEKLWLWALKPLFCSWESCFFWDGCELWNRETVCSCSIRNLLNWRIFGWTVMIIILMHIEEASNSHVSWLYTVLSGFSVRVPPQCISYLSKLSSFGETDSNARCILLTIPVTPWKINSWNLKMMVWKMIFLFQGCILMFHVYRPGCKLQHVDQSVARNPWANFQNDWPIDRPIVRQVQTFVPRDSNWSGMW